ncbi:hypothetical protein CHARACLAT_017458 [Characodon lateralis]|uniref:Uncharacterized protein n=1 Tax=Characodon lateralis TaxID=208331 RepID=A0ABU7EUH7_9TELE|nr:hypothetical protein [Characodon lateralis]
MVWWPAELLCAIPACLAPDLALVSGLEITTTQVTPLEKASGQSVKLDCQFTVGPEDSGPLDIEWSLLAADNQKEDKVALKAPVQFWYLEVFVCVITPICLLMKGLSSRETSSDSPWGTFISFLLLSHLPELLLLLVL